MGFAYFFKNPWVILMKVVLYKTCQESMDIPYKGRHAMGPIDLGL